MAQNSITFKISDDVKSLLDKVDPIYIDTIINMAIKMLSRDPLYNYYFRLESTLPQDVKAELTETVNQVTAPEEVKKEEKSTEEPKKDEVMSINWDGGVF